MGKEKGPATLTMFFFKNNEIKFPAFKMKMKIAILAPEDSHNTEFFKKNYCQIWLNLNHCSSSNTTKLDQYVNIN
jgi:hypothetical protein